MRVAITGANGRLGRALVEALGSAPWTGPLGPLAWSRPVFDLDAPERFAALLDAERPEAVVHAAAWTDVDGCALDPEAAMRRNGEAVGVLASACAARGVDLVFVSTNEVFDGHRTDGRGYAVDDPPAPINPYGLSKLHGEAAARTAYASSTGRTSGPYVPGSRPAAGPQLAIVRTAWLYGPPGSDFPDKILAAAARAATEGVALRVVGDEFGQPTATGDLGEAIVELLGSGGFEGLHHCVNAGAVSRAGWARVLLDRAGVDVPIQEIPAAAWSRASTPPRWGVLEPTPTPSGEPMRRWQDALADDLVRRRRARIRVK
jgi:dTDP-4-dehydrorhamnose reductase